MPIAITPTSGQKVVGDLIFKQDNADRGTSLQLGLFTNTVALTEDAVLADVAEPTGGSYARITLADANWSVSSDGVCSYAKQTFFADGSAYSADITGFFIATTGTTPRLFHLQIEDAPVAVAANESYSVTPIIDVGSGV